MDTVERVLVSKHFNQPLLLPLLHTGVCSILSFEENVLCIKAKCFGDEEVTNGSGYMAMNLQKKD